MNARAIEDDMSSWSILCVGFDVAEDVLIELEREPADVVVVDCLLAGALSAAEASGLPTAGLFHTLFRYILDDDAYPTDWQEEYELLQATRSRLGLPELPRERPLAELWGKPARVLALVPREYDFPMPAAPVNARYVGPVFGDGAGGWDLPFPHADGEPIVMVTFSSTYMHHEKPLERVAEAVASLPVHAVLSLAGALAPEEIHIPEGIVVRDWVSFPAVLPHTDLVVSHAGLTTAMASLSYGVPMLCMPLGRDQPLNAERVVACGAGQMISAEAAVDEIRASILDILGSERHRRAAGQMARVIARYGNGAVALDELEGLLAKTMPGRPDPCAG
jgi:MGT family glycosyltransferase